MIIRIDFSYNTLYTSRRRDLQLAACIPSHDNQRFVIGWIGAVTAIRFVVTSLPPVWSRCKRSMVRVVLHRWTFVTPSSDVYWFWNSRSRERWRGEETFFSVEKFIYLFLELKFKKRQQRNFYNFSFIFKHREIILISKVSHVDIIMIKSRNHIFVCNREIWIYAKRKREERTAFNFWVSTCRMQYSRWKIREHILIIAEISFSSACLSLFRYEIGFVRSTKRLISPWSSLQKPHLSRNVKLYVATEGILTNLVIRQKC